MASRLVAVDSRTDTMTSRSNICRFALDDVGEEKLRAAAGCGEEPFGGVVLVPSVPIDALFLAKDCDAADEQREARLCLKARTPWLGLQELMLARLKYVVEAMPRPEPSAGSLDESAKISKMACLRRVEDAHYPITAVIPLETC